MRAPSLVLAWLIAACATGPERPPPATLPEVPATIPRKDQLALLQQHIATLRVSLGLPEAQPAGRGTGTGIEDLQEVGPLEPSLPRPAARPGRDPEQCQAVCRVGQEICGYSQRICRLAGELADPGSQQACRGARRECSEADRHCQRC